MYAVIKTGGKQYKVEQGDVVFVEKLNAEEGTEVTFDEVLALGGEKKAKIGTPTVKGATVTGKVLKQGRSKKISLTKTLSKLDFYNVWPSSQEFLDQGQPLLPDNY